MKKALLLCKAVLILACLPFLLGQQECQVDQALMDLFKQKTGTVPAGQNALYITNLTFMDSTTKTSMFLSETGTLINDAVKEGIALAQKTNPNIKHNEAGHLIQDTDENVKKLIEITYDPNLTGAQKLGKFQSEMMTPNNVDVIVSGQFIDQGAQVQVRPFTIDRVNQKVVLKDATFAKADFVCADPNSASKKVLCKGAYEEIAKLVKELLEQL